MKTRKRGGKWSWSWPWSRTPKTDESIIKTTQDCISFAPRPFGKTYIVHRHGFSCANLAKKAYSSVGKFFMGTYYDLNDPSLTLDAIVDILSTDFEIKSENDFVCVSPLIRTWQTAILIYFSLENGGGVIPKTTLLVTPYIKEKGNDGENMPLDIRLQLEKMDMFFNMLLYIKKTVAKPPQFKGQQNLSTQENGQSIIKKIDNILNNSKIILVHPNNYVANTGTQVKTLYEKIVEPSGVYNEPNRISLLTIRNEQSIETGQPQDWHLNIQKGKPPYKTLSNGSSIKKISVNEDYAKLIIGKIIFRPSNADVQNVNKKSDQLCYTIVRKSPIPDSWKNYCIHVEKPFSLIDLWIPSILRLINHNSGGLTTINMVSHSQTMQGMLKYYSGKEYTNEHVLDQNCWSIRFDPNFMNIFSGLDKPKENTFSKEPLCTNSAKNGGTRRKYNRKRSRKKN